MPNKCFSEDDTKEAREFLGKYVPRIEISDNEDIILDKDGVILCKWHEKNGIPQISRTRKVIIGKFRPLRRLELDGETLFEVETTRKFRGNAEEILAQLKREGVIVHKARASDAINALLSGLDLPVEKGHATFGVFKTESGELELCLEPQPRSDSQNRVKIQISRKIHTEATVDHLIAWLRLSEFWHMYELYPVMGLAAIAPFALVLRDAGVLVPYLYHVSPESGLGKTELLRLFTRRLFGNEVLSTDAIKSDYRLADTLDSFGGLIAIEEAENLPWERFSPHLQLAAEQPLQDARGTGSLGMRPYWSRAVLGFSGNCFPTRRKALLVRFIMVEFDRSSLRERRKLENRKRLKNIVKQLKPIGWHLIKAEINTVNTVEKLIERIESHEERIEELYSGNFEDPRRAMIWAVVYEGLQAWQRFAEQMKVNWQAPDYEEFVNEVVTVIEANAFAQVEAPVAQFIAWWHAWKATHTSHVDGVEVIKGHGEIWREYEVMVDGKKINGDVVTRAVLDLYERENRHRGGLAVLTLGDLNKGVEALYGIPASSLPASARISGKKFKVAFVPAEDGVMKEKLTPPQNTSSKVPPPTCTQNYQHQTARNLEKRNNEKSRFHATQSRLRSLQKANGTVEPEKCEGAQKNCGNLSQQELAEKVKSALIKLQKKSIKGVSASEIALEIGNKYQVTRIEDLLKEWYDKGLVYKPEPKSNFWRWVG